MTGATPTVVEEACSAGAEVWEESQRELGRYATVWEGGGGGTGRGGSLATPELTGPLQSLKPATPDAPRMATSGYDVGKPREDGDRADPAPGRREGRWAEEGGGWRGCGGAGSEVVPRRGE